MGDLNKPNPEYDPNKHEPKELTTKQREDLLIGLVRFLGFDNKEYKTMAANALYGRNKCKPRPTEEKLSKLPGPEYDPERHYEEDYDV